MLRKEEILLAFQNSIQRQLEEEVAQIQSEINQFEQAQVEKLRAEAQQDCAATLKNQEAQIGLEFTTRRSRYLSDAKRKLLIKRDEYVNQVFTQVKERLEQFTKTPEYGDYLVKKLLRAVEEYRMKQPQVQLRPGDMHLAPALQKACPACQVEPCEEIVSGGLIIRESGKAFIVDESLDGILQDQQEWFYSHSGLRIPQF